MGTFEDEQIEINQKFLFEDEFDSEDENISDSKVEVASDDDEMCQKLKGRHSKYLQDESASEGDFGGSGAESSEDEINMNDLENESLLSDENTRLQRKQNNKLNPVSKRTRAENVRDVDLGEECEEDDTIFIDNLPSDEFSIRRQLVEVKNYIRHYEQLFFEEEDSDREEELKRITNVK